MLSVYKRCTWLPDSQLMVLVISVRTVYSLLLCHMSVNCVVLVYLSVKENDTRVAFKTVELFYCHFSIIMYSTNVFQRFKTLCTRVVHPNACI